MGTYSAWERTVTLRLLGDARGAGPPTGGGEEGGGILCRHAHILFLVAVKSRRQGGLKTIGYEAALFLGN